MKRTLHFVVFFATLVALASHARAQERRVPGNASMARNYFQSDPVISHFAHQVGAGNKVVVRGFNLPGDAMIRIAGVDVTPEIRQPNAVVFQVPSRVQSGPIFLRSSSLDRPLYVGEFTPRSGTWQAETNELRRRRWRVAERAWRQRKPNLGRSRAQRETARGIREDEMRRSRAERRRNSIAGYRARWQTHVLRAPQARAELALHSRRMARLWRMLRLAESLGRDNMVIRVDVAMARERQRHRSRMAALRTRIARR